MADSSKTEKATPKKKRDERKKGHVFLSQDAVSVATLVCSAAILFLMGPYIAEQIGQFITHCMQLITNGQSLEAILPEILPEALLLIVKTAFPALFLTAIGSIAATFAQTRMLISSTLLKPKFSRINPIQGFGKLFSLNSIMEALKGILKIILLLIVIWLSLEVIYSERLTFLYADVNASCEHIFSSGKSMMIKIIVAFAGLAAADFFYQWWKFEKDMRMTKQEIKEEYKQMEGDPKVKGKIKEIQRKRAMSRMMQNVPQADVVVRNPTHFAVALRYCPEIDGAPIVLAKGQDELALRIVKVAEEAKVPVMENVPLARALYAKAEINSEIPQELYGPVAEVLVYIFKLNEDQELVK